MRYLLAVSLALLMTATPFAAQQSKPATPEKPPVPAKPRPVAGPLTKLTPVYRAGKVLAGFSLADLLGGDEATARRFEQALRDFKVELGVAGDLNLTAPEQECWNRYNRVHVNYGTASMALRYARGNATEAAGIKLEMKALDQASQSWDEAKVGMAEAERLYLRKPEPKATEQEIPAGSVAKTSGIVTAVSLSSITVRDASRERTIVVDPKTSVLGGEPALTLQLAKEGRRPQVTDVVGVNDQVDVIYSNDGQALRARMVSLKVKASR